MIATMKGKCSDNICSRLKLAVFLECDDYCEKKGVWHGSGNTATKAHNALNWISTRFFPLSFLYYIFFHCCVYFFFWFVKIKKILTKSLTHANILNYGVKLCCNKHNSRGEMFEDYGILNSVELILHIWWS